MLVFFFTDIEGSTQLWESHAEEMGAVLARHDAILQEQIAASGGRITKHTGDGVTAVFEAGGPVACALETQVRFAAEAWGDIGNLRIRVGLHAGEAELRAAPGLESGDYYGPPVNCAARIMAAAWGEQILLTSEVAKVSPLPLQSTLLDLGQHLLKDVSAPQQIYQLLHPRLPRAEFPPPRSLSGSTISELVGQQGQRLAGLKPEGMVVGLVSATLLPAVLGGTAPESLALAGNVGVLHDLGAGALAEFLTGFVQRRQPDKPEEIRRQLEAELRQVWEGGGPEALALQTGAGRLLQAVEGVEAAMTAAAGDVRAVLARGLADLGSQFDEFRWMLADLQQVLAEVRTRQALQLALQREQLDLQRQQLVKTNLLLHRQQAAEAASPAVGEAAGLAEPELPPVSTAPAGVICPYKGLAAFEAEDAEYFCGREELVAELTARLTGTRFLAVVGPSGSGKSSVVRAGLLPAVWGDALPDSKAWRTLVLTPGSHPLEELAVRLSLLQGIEVSALLEGLQVRPQALHLAVQQALTAEPEGALLLLVVDQFEEVFALCRSEAERRAFIDALLYAVEAEEGRTVVVPTIRADFYGHCADYPRLAARLADNLLVGPLTEEELCQAIEWPAQRAGLRLEAGLADTIVDDVAGEPGALPLVSHALLETWGRRRGRMLTLAGYAASGGVAGAISQTADSVYGQFSPEEQATALHILLRLTELGEEGTQDTRRRAAPQELVRTAEDEPLVQSVLTTLAGARLITVGEDTVEVAHEALIREWPVLRGWLDEDREGLRIHRHLTGAAQDWEALDREPGELYRGARLFAAGEWAGGHAGELNPLEREFLSVSQEMARREAKEREARRQRELEAARERAEELAGAARRFRRLAGVLAVVLLLAAVATALALWQQRQTQEQARVATSRELAAAAINNLNVDPERSVLLALQGLSTAYTLEAENALHASIPELHLLMTLTGHVEMPESIAVSPDGTRLASAGDAGVVKVWDAVAGQELLSFATGHTGVSIFGMTYSPDGARIATASDDGTTKVWDASSGEQLLLINHGAPLSGLAFSPDGKRLATAGADPATRVWDSSTGEQMLVLTGHADTMRAGSVHPGGVISVLFSPDGERLATAGADGTARLWDAGTGEPLRTIADHVDEIYIALSPDGHRLLTAGYDGWVRVWDVEPGSEVTEPLVSIDHGQPARAAAFGPGGARIAVAGQDGAARVWDAASGRRLLTLAGHSGLVDDLAFTPDGTRLVTVGEDETVRVWDLAPGSELLTLAHAAAPAFSPDGRRLATSQPDGTVAVRDSMTGEVLVALDGHPEFGAGSLAFSPDGKRLATSSWDTSAKLWDAATGQELFTLPDHTGFVFQAAFSPDGTRLATASADGTGKVWDTSTGQVLFALLGHESWVQGVAYSPDGMHIATSSDDGTARIWDAANGQELETLNAGGSLVGIAFSPDGERLAASGADGTSTIWDLADLDYPADAESQVMSILSGHAAFVPTLAFSPDGDRLATASFDGTAKVWDVSTGQEWLTLSAQDALASVAFSPNGERLATGGFGGGHVRVYALDLEKLQALAESRVTRSLTDEECQKFLHVEKCPTSVAGGE